MNSLIKNYTQYETNCSYHNYNTRSKDDLHFELKNLSLVQKGVKYAAIKTFNALPNNIKCKRENEMLFKCTLKKYLLDHPLYSVDEFFSLNNALS